MKDRVGTLVMGLEEDIMMATMVTILMEVVDSTKVVIVAVVSTMETVAKTRAVIMLALVKTVEVIGVILRVVVRMLMMVVVEAGTLAMVRVDSMGALKLMVTMTDLMLTTMAVGSMKETIMEVDSMEVMGMAVGETGDDTFSDNFLFDFLHIRIDHMVKKF